MTQILRNLPDDSYQAAINASSSSALNPFLTLADVPGLTNAYASYHSNSAAANQTSPAATPTPMFFHVTALQNNVSVTAGNTINILDPGVYNVQFSAQVEKTGGTAGTIYIWPEINGTPLSNSNTGITLANNGHRAVAAWNWYIDLLAGDDLQLMWTSDTGDVELINEVPPIGPGIPAVIVTLQKVG